MKDEKKSMQLWDDFLCGYVMCVIRIELLMLNWILFDSVLYIIFNVFFIRKPPKISYYPFHCIKLRSLKLHNHMNVMHVICIS